MPDHRGRDGINMGHMGPRPLPPMDMRRMDGQPMRGRDMDPRDMRGREPNRDFFRPGEEPDFSLRRHYESNINMMNSSGFPGPGRNLDMGGRGMLPREPNRFDMRQRESINYNMPRFNTPNVDGGRGFPMDRMERNDGFRDMRDRPQVDINDSRFEMNLPPRERRMMDTDRRGGPPFNQRGGFDCDTDFRNRPGSSGEFRGRDRSPLTFGNSDIPSVDRARSDMPPTVAAPQRSKFTGAKDTLRESEYPDSSDSPLMDYRSGEEMTLAEEWKNRQKDQNPFLNMNKGMGGVPQTSFPVGFSRDANASDTPPFQERERPSVKFPGKDVGFPHGDHFPGVDLPPIGSKGPQNHLPPEQCHINGPPDRENKNKHWLGENQSQNKPHCNERPTYPQDKKQPSHEIAQPSNCFNVIKDMPQGQGPAKDKMGIEHDFQSSSSSSFQVGDQDYRDIDYRTGSGSIFHYKHKDLQPPEKLIKESKPMTPSKFTESGCQVCGFLFLLVLVFNTVYCLLLSFSITFYVKGSRLQKCISGGQSFQYNIHNRYSKDCQHGAGNKNSNFALLVTRSLVVGTDGQIHSIQPFLWQILGAFAVDGVPMQGMKIKSVVPGMI